MFDSLWLESVRLDPKNLHTVLNGLNFFWGKIIQYFKSFLVLSIFSLTHKPFLWNDLPVECHTSTSVNAFKKNYDLFKNSYIQTFYLLLSLFVFFIFCYSLYL